MFVADLALRWLHILGAIILVGGSIFMRFGYGPASAGQSDEDRHALQEAMVAQWRKWVMISAGFLLISGLVNTGLISMKYDLPGYYHALLGIKALLALAVFFLSSRLVGRSEKAIEMRGQLNHWLNVNLALAIAVVAMAGAMKVTVKTPKEKQESTQIIRQIESDVDGQKG